MLTSAQRSGMQLMNALQLADKEFYPNIYEVFKLLLTSPVGSIPCERSFSALRRLKDRSRSTMTEDRLVGLALLYTHRDMGLEGLAESVLKRFDCTRHRRIGQLSL